MTSSQQSPDHTQDPAYHSAEPRTVAGEQPGDYGVASPDAYRGVGAAPDPGNVEDIDQITAPLDDDDDVHDRIALVNTENADRLEQIRNRVRGAGHGDR